VKGAGAQAGVALLGKPVHQQNYCNNKQEQFDN